METNPTPILHFVRDKAILFVQGKGGVGKTTVAHALAHLSAETHRTLLVSMEDPLRKPFDLQKLSPNLDHLNNDPTSAFEEYVGMKVGAPALARVFLQNRLMRYLARAAPGIRELVLMGKIWHEQKKYPRIVVDMPATGHGVTLFQALFNWGSLFEGSPLAKDAQSMITTLSDPAQTGHLIVALPEEMPLIESLELRQQLLRIFPKLSSGLALNRTFPHPRGEPETYPEERPFALSAREHAWRKIKEETENLGIWANECYAHVPFFSPESGEDELLKNVMASLRQAGAA